MLLPSEKVGGGKWRFLGYITPSPDNSVYLPCNVLNLEHDEYAITLYDATASKYYRNYEAHFLTEEIKRFIVQPNFSNISIPITVASTSSNLIYVEFIYEKINSDLGFSMGTMMINGTAMSTSQRSNYRMYVYAR